VREFPIFVPFGQNHLAAILAVPDDEPAGLVLLTTGTGAPRSHRFQLWTSVARRLADRGIASVRMDYLGVGDSSGRVQERRMGELDLRIDEAEAVTRFAQEAVGAERMAAVGNCSGGLVALGVAVRVPGFVGTTCILPRVLQPTKVNQVVIGLRGSKMASLARSSNLLRPIVHSLRGRKGKPRSVVQERMASALSRGRLLFVYSELDTDAFNEQSKMQIERILARLPEEHRARFELRVLPRGPLSGFESLEVQSDVIDVAVDWTAACFNLQPMSTQAASAS
jgi:dienelactone hydrolase